MTSAAMTAFLQVALAARLERLTERMAHDWSGNADRLHDVRVASRRARAALDLLDLDFHPRAKVCRKQLRAFTRALGRVRGLDVQLALLGALKSRGLEPIHQAVLEHAEEVLEQVRAKARRRLGDRTSMQETRELRELLSRSTPAAPPSAELAAEARILLEPACRAVLDELRTLVGIETPEPLHALRIRLKRFRYAVEIFAPLLASSSEMLPRLRQLQTALGDHHDLVELEQFLWSLHSQLTARRRAVLATELLDVLGLVAELRHQRYQEFAALQAEFLEDDPLEALFATDTP